MKITMQNFLRVIPSFIASISLKIPSLYLYRFCGNPKVFYYCQPTWLSSTVASGAFGVMSVRFFCRWLISYIPAGKKWKEFLFFLHSHVRSYLIARLWSCQSYMCLQKIELSVINVIGDDNLLCFYVVICCPNCVKSWSCVVSINPNGLMLTTMEFHEFCYQVAELNFIMEHIYTEFEMYV